MPTTLLARDAIEVEGTHYGVPVSTYGEDGDMLALGHHDPRRAVAAFNRHARRFLGLLNILDDRRADATDVADLLADTVHGHGLFRLPNPELEEDPDYVWVMEECTADTPGAVPVTILRIS